MSFFTKTKSPVWEFFEILDDNKMMARCKLCKNSVSRGGIGRKASTTPLYNHLKSKHPNQHSKDNVNTGNAEFSVLDEDQDDPCSSHGVKRKQQTLQACFEKKNVGH